MIAVEKAGGDASAHRFACRVPICGNLCNLWIDLFSSVFGMSTLRSRRAGLGLGLVITCGVPHTTKDEKLLVGHSIEIGIAIEIAMRFQSRK